MSKLHLDGRTYQVAGKWNDLTRAQLLRVVRILCTPAPETLTQQRLLTTLLQLWKRPRLAWQFIRMPLLDVAAQLPLVGFLQAGRVQLTRQLLPVLRTAWWRRPWYGPGDRLAKLTYAEWIDAESALHQWRKNQSEEQLNRLVAILYRPARRKRPELASDNGDRRQAYNSEHVEARARQAARLDQFTKLAVLLYYDGCRQYHFERNPNIFESDGEQQAATQGENPALAYYRILRVLAGGPDKYDIIGQQLLTNVLFEVEERMIDAAKLEEKIAS